ncbi:hypothetical protein E4V51_25415, partial [Paenibacillus sp. 28ISP30-2]|nr:hypothetical protein [Paenibacillus sp. 28ISP30-2]
FKEKPPYQSPKRDLVSRVCSSDPFGNAATPMVIQAIQERRSPNPRMQPASPALCTLPGLNTASITLIPTTLIAIRLNYHSANPTEIVGTTLVATAIATFAAIAADRWYRSRELRRPPASPPSTSSLPSQKTQAPQATPVSASSPATPPVSSPAVPRSGMTAAKGRNTTWKG